MDLHIGWELELFGGKALYILKVFLHFIAILFRIANIYTSALNNSLEKPQFKLFQNKSVLNSTLRWFGLFMKRNEKRILGGFILLTNTTEDPLWWVVWGWYEGSTKGTGGYQRTHTHTHTLCKFYAEHTCAHLRYVITPYASQVIVDHWKNIKKLLSYF